MAFLDYRNRNRAITAVETVFCVLVEPYPPHFEPLRRNFRHQPCKIILGAVAQEPGRRRFHSQWAGKSGPEFWGGCLSGQGDIEVEAYTLPDLMALAGIDKITFLHMDIQGEEENIAGACLDLHRQGKLENIYVGTHGERRHRRVRAILCEQIPLRLDAPARSRPATESCFSRIPQNSRLFLDSNRFSWYSVLNPGASAMLRSTVLVTHRQILPATSGNRVRILQLIRSLRAAGWRVAVILPAAGRLEEDRSVFIRQSGRHRQETGEI